MRIVPLVTALLLASASLGSYAESIDTAAASDLPRHDASDAKAPAVTEANLLESERFWPYRVSLTAPFQPEGAPKPLQKGTLGVLIRVEASRRARIDFSRDGVHEVLVAGTDLLEQANQIRRGEAWKKAPNFVLAIGPRLVDSTGDSLRPFLYRRALEQRGFLAVFADPAAQGFAELAAALAPLGDRPGLLTVVFPNAATPDERMREQMRSLGWRAAFVYDHLAEAYTASLVPAGSALPFVSLQTAEGRLLFQGAWTDEAPSQLVAAVDAAFPDTTAVSAGGARTIERTGDAPQGSEPSSRERRDHSKP